MTKLKSLFFYLSFLSSSIILNTSCNKSKQGLEDGVWRATLKTEAGVEIPFNFKVADSAGKKTIFILNGNDKFKVDEISSKDDSIIIKIPVFESEIRAELSDGLQGKWVKHLADRDQMMPFEAQANTDWRFSAKPSKPKMNVTGRWSTSFISTSNDSTQRDTSVAVGEFKQNDSKLTGTFLTPSGDYRFLEGTVSDNKFFLSTFDGSNAYLFTGIIDDNNTISNGKFYSGFSSVEDWNAKRDNNAILPDAYSITTLKEGTSRLDFSFPDLDKKNVSINDPRFKNKVVIVQILGSWCPNCMDETAYLAPFYNKYKKDGLEVIGLAYERTADFDRSRKNIERLKQRFDINYPVLITGYTKDKGEVLKSLPMLADFNGFPTTIIIDKKGNVRKIHTGFNGPGTGVHYTEFRQEFEKLIGELLQES